VDALPNPLGRYGCRAEEVTLGIGEGEVQTPLPILHTVAREVEQVHGVGHAGSGEKAFDLALCLPAGAVDFSFHGVLAFFGVVQHPLQLFHVPSGRT
jgi:hypothetical protein